VFLTEQFGSGPSKPGTQGVQVVLLILDSACCTNQLTTLLIPALTVVDHLLVDEVC
jgi:hypothetical protein